MVTVAPSSSAMDVQARFMSLLPKIVTHARITFRPLCCPVRREEAIQECVGLCWKWHVRLCERGKDAAAFPMAFAFLVVKAVRSGRRTCGMEKAKDVFSPVAQRKHGFRVESLPASQDVYPDGYSRPRGQQHLDAFEERLHDNTQTPVPDQVVFRLDFPAWLGTLTSRDRRLIKAMGQDERTKDLSRRFKVSQGRISELRRRFETDWKSFCGDMVDVPA